MIDTGRTMIGLGFVRESLTNPIPIMKPARRSKIVSRPVNFG
jgi:hypothetical protein